MDLMRRHAFLAGGRQEQGGKPFGQRNLGTLKYGADRDRELLTAGRFVALVDASAVSLAL